MELIKFSHAQSEDESIKAMRPFIREFSIRIIFYTYISITIASCYFNHSFYNLGQGFKYGYFDSKKTLNVYFNDQGVVQGICYSVEWNDKYILMHYYSYDSIGNDLYVRKTCLINKELYINYPIQLESKGIISASEDSIHYILDHKNIILSNKQEINPDDK